MRFFALIIAALFVALVSIPPASALMVAFKPAYQRAATADVVCVGKVTSIEKDTVEIESRKGAPKTTYHVAVVKVEDPLVNAAGLTHIKVGFVMPTMPGKDGIQKVPGAPNVLIRPAIARVGAPAPELKVGDEWVFFLSKHPTANFLLLSPMSPPLDLSKEQGKKELEAVKKAAAVLADPTRSLKSEKAEDRYCAALIVLSKHKAYPDFSTGGVDQVPIDAAESKLILEGLKDGDWSKNDGTSPSGMQAIGMLGLSPKEGWQYPKIKPGEDVGSVYKKAFDTWLAGPGKNFVVKKNVPKTSK